jgi:dynein heavy chain, axonemal
MGEGEGVRSGGLPVWPGRQCAVGPTRRGENTLHLKLQFTSCRHAHRPNPRPPQSRVREAEETERSINAARESYRPAATRASVVYFAVADLALVSPMYQWSLALFARMFKQCIEASGASDDVATRLGLLCAYTTEHVFRAVSRGLFEEHKGLFSFLLAASIARHPSAGEVSEREWALLLRGAPAAAVAAAAAGGPAGGGAAAPAAARPEWLGEAAWRALAHAESVCRALQGVAASFASGPDAAAWRAW